jgi:hypothetical protein
MILTHSQDSQSRHQSSQPRLHAAILSGGGHAPIALRLWELEALITAGCDLTEALTVISARRERSVGEALRPAIAAAYRARVS